MLFSHSHTDTHIHIHTHTHSKTTEWRRVCVCGCVFWMRTHQKAGTEKQMQSYKIKAVKKKVLWLLWFIAEPTVAANTPNGEAVEFRAVLLDLTWFTSLFYFEFGNYTIMFLAPVHTTMSLFWKGILKTTVIWVWMSVFVEIISALKNTPLNTYHRTIPILMSVEGWLVYCRKTEEEVEI